MAIHAAGTTLTFVRACPDRSAEKLGVAKRGRLLTLTGEVSTDGWRGVVYLGMRGWASGRYAKTDV